MRFLKRFGIAVAMLAVLGMTMAAMASAADALFLEFAKTGFKVSGGAGNLTTLGNPFGVNCTALTGSGNTGGNNTETFTGSLTFTGCNANSLGDAAKTILFKIAGSLCFISEAPLTVGLLIEATEAVHLENVPIAGLVVFAVKSTDVGTITPINTKTKTFELKLESAGTGDQKVKSCTNLGKTFTPAIKAFIAEGKSEIGGSITQTATLTTESEGKIDG